MHTDYPTTSKQNTNAQLLDFDATAWIIDLPVHNLSLIFTKAPPQAKASTPWPVFWTKCTAHQTTHVTTDHAFFDTAKSAPFSANATLKGCNPYITQQNFLIGSFPEVKLFHWLRQHCQYLHPYMISPYKIFTTHAPYTYIHGMHLTFLWKNLQAYNIFKTVYDGKRNTKHNTFPSI